MKFIHLTEKLRYQHYYHYYIANTTTTTTYAHINQLLQQGLCALRVYLHHSMLPTLNVDGNDNDDDDGDGGSGGSG